MNQKTINVNGLTLTMFPNVKINTNDEIEFITDIKGFNKKGLRVFHLREYSTMKSDYIYLLKQNKNNILNINESESEDIQQVMLKDLFNTLDRMFVIFKNTTKDN